MFGIRTLVITSCFFRVDNRLEFHDDLQEAIDDDKGGKLIVIGDFNAKVGQKEDDEECVGNYGFGRRNPRGSRMWGFIA